MNAKRYNEDWYAMADPAIVKDIGKGIKQMRLNKNLSQEELANRAGLGRATISQMERGRPVTLLTLVQVFRALERLDVLNVFKEEPEISPIKLLKLQEQQRRKASPVKKDKEV